MANYREVLDKYIELGKVASIEAKTELREGMISEVDPIYDELYSAYEELMTFKVDGGNSLATQAKYGAHVP